jgi:predicted AAA+ superfamily ATPase
MFDTGILRHIREAAVPSIQLMGTLTAGARTPLGGIIENQTAIELHRGGLPLYGWKKSSSGTEIDFVYQLGARVVPVECKAALAVNLKHTRGLCDYMEIYGLDLGIVISLAPQAELSLSGGGTIENMPAYLAERLGCTGG